MSVRKHASQIHQPEGAVRMQTDCVTCKHLREGSVCVPFPQGIPGPVYHGFTSHHVSVPGQVGLTLFDPRPEAEVAWLDEAGLELTTA